MNDKETKTMDIVAYSLTKREFFAAMALQGLLSKEDPEKGTPMYERVGAPSLAVSYADALIKALERGGE